MASIRYIIFKETLKTFILFLKLNSHNLNHSKKQQPTKEKGPIFDFNFICSGPLVAVNYFVFAEMADYTTCKFLMAHT